MELYARQFAAVGIRMLFASGNRRENEFQMLEDVWTCILSGKKNGDSQEKRLSGFR